MPEAFGELERFLSRVDDRFWWTASFLWRQPTLGIGREKELLSIPALRYVVRHVRRHLRQSRYGREKTRKLLALPPFLSRNQFNVMSVTCFLVTGFLSPGFLPFSHFLRARGEGSLTIFAIGIRANSRVGLMRIGRNEIVEQLTEQMRQFAGEPAGASR